MAAGPLSSTPDPTKYAETFFQKRLGTILQPETNVQLFPLFSASRPESSSSPGSSSGVNSPKRKFSFFSSKSKVAASSSASTSKGRIGESPVEVTVQKINTIKKKIIELKELRDSEETFARLDNKVTADQIRSKIETHIKEKEQQLAPLQEAYVQSTQPKVDGIRRLLDVLPKDKLKSPKLAELKEFIQTVYEDPALIQGLESKYEAHQSIIKNFDAIMKNEKNFNGLALYFASEALKKSSKSPFFIKDMEGGSGKVISIGLKDENGENKHPFFVFKPTNSSVGASQYVPKIKQASHEDFIEDAMQDISDGLEKAQNLEISQPKHLKEESQGKTISLSPLVLVVSDKEIKTLVDFKSKYPPDHEEFKDLTPAGVQLIYGAVGSLLNYRIDGVIGIAVNLSTINPQNISIPKDIRDNIIRQRAEGEKEIAAQGVIRLSSTVNEIFGGVNAVAANHVVRAGLTELGGKSPPSMLLKKSPWGEGILMEYTHHIGSLETITNDKKEKIIALLENATDEVKRTVCNQYILDTIFGETDMNSGNCLVTSMTAEGQITGISTIDMSLCMPKQNTYGKDGEGMLERSVSFYNGHTEALSFLEHNHPFLTERIAQVDAIFPSLISVIKERYQSAGAPLTDFQVTSMIARWEFLKIATKEKMDTGPIQNSALGTSYNGVNLFEILKDFPKDVDFTKQENLQALGKSIKDEIDRLASKPTSASGSTDPV